MIKKFIKSIREEKDGFSFDQPWRLGEKSLGVIIPIIRKSQEKRDYIVFAEARQIKVEDTGQIDYVFVQNNEVKPLLISRGEIFRGKTQERAAIHDHIIKSKQGLRVAVRCIHQSRSISHGAEMKYGGRTPYAVNYVSQSQTWKSASEMANSMNVARTEWSSNTNTDFLGSSDDLVGTLDNLTDAMKEAFKKIPYVKNQVGAAFFSGNEMSGMDVYDLPKSWDAIKKDVVEKEGASFLKKDNAEMFSFKPEKGRKLIKEHLSADFEEKEIYNREYKLIELRSSKLIGEAIEFQNKVIHLTFWKK